MNLLTLEEQLLNEVQKFLLPGVVFTPNDNIDTQNGTYTVDATLNLAGQTIVIERGDKEDTQKHDPTTEVLWKDAIMIHQAGVDKIYRFAKREIEMFLPELIYLLAKELPDFFDYTTIKTKPSKFLQFFHKTSYSKYCNKILIRFQDPEDDHRREKQSGFHYYYADAKEWFPDYGTEGLLVGELYPNKNAQELYNILRTEISEPEKFNIFDRIFDLIEQEKPGVFANYIKYYKNDYYSYGRKGELINKYKQLAGYPLTKDQPTSNTTDKKSFSQRNILVWNEFINKVRPAENEITSVTWTDRESILSILNTALYYSKLEPNHILFFVPNGGDFFLTNFTESIEEGFIEFESSSTLRKAKIASLDFIAEESWPDKGYFKLNFAEVDPIALPADEAIYEEPVKPYQLLLEYAPGKYEYYGNPIKHRQYTRDVERFTKGYLVLFRNCPLSHPIFRNPVLALES